MSIVSSVIAEDRAQIDGRRSIRERHTDHLGLIEEISYLAEAGADVASAMAARVSQLDARAVDAEMARNIAFIMVGDYAKVTTNYVTVSDARAAIRALYSTGSGEIIGRLAGYLLTLTNGQLQALFNVSAGSQTTQLRARLQAKVDALNVVLTAVGE